METTLEEMANTLRSTEKMADQFAKCVQKRLDRSVSYSEILSAMKKIPAKSLSMGRVVAKLKLQKSRRK